MVPGRARRRSLIQAAAAAAIGALLREQEAEARPLEAEQVARLRRGEVVRVPLDIDLKAGDYFGGVAYAIVPASVETVMGVLADPATYTKVLPMTLESRVLPSPGPDRRVFFRQGHRRVGTADYVLLVRRESPGLIRFWLDASEPHDIADMFGYFRAQPWGPRSCILTYAALLHLDFGVVKLLFSEKIRQIAFTTPGRIRAYVESHAAPTR
jgi:hypothetical protein